MKILKKDLFYQNIEDRSHDIGITLNGINLVNMTRKQSKSFFKIYKLINDNGDIIIPKGFELIGANQHDGVLEYIFKSPKDKQFVLIEVDLAIDENEYF